MRMAISMAAAWLAAACYDYQPLATPSPEPGTYMVATLTDSGSEELARVLGPDVLVVRGRYLGDSDRGMLVSVSGVETKRGSVLSWAGETVALPVHDVAELEVRKLAKGRSALLVGAGVAGLVATTAAFALTGSGPNPTLGKGRPTPQ
jgi:hypothetical protein